MCEYECFGNYHRKCQHYVKLYESGVVKDCKSPMCRSSSMHAHRHTAGRQCQCQKICNEERRVLNLIQDWCDACKKAAWASLEIEQRC